MQCGSKADYLTKHKIAKLSVLGLIINSKLLDTKIGNGVTKYFNKEREKRNI